jgi:membrane protease subunit HflK
MNKKSFEAFAQVLEHIIKYFKWAALAAVALIALSGVYRVEGNEAAVVLRFGRLVGETYERQVKKPGLHFALPFMIDEVIKIPVQTVHERTVTTHYGQGSISANIESNGYLLTGDNNVVLIRVKVKYKIDNPARYALYSRDAEGVIDGVVSGELTRSVTRTDIDSVLTSGKAELSSEIMKRAQAILDALDTGIAITNIELTEVMPPAETKSYFEEVINASVDKETGIQQAKEQAATLLLGAQAQAKGYKQEAISQQNARLTVVRAEMAEFNGLYDQYARNPRVIIEGTFRERVSAVLVKMGGAVIVPEGKSPVVVLP